MNTQQIDEKAVFNAARRIPDAAARDDYISQACGDDQSAAHRIQALLRIHEEEQSFLESPAARLDHSPPHFGVGLGEGLTDTRHLTPDTFPEGTVIGPYKLLQQIGEGGMGVVFMAEQSEPIHRTVALKIIKPGMDTRQVIARFEAERQALAMMDHPNIAKVLDAGTTGEGSGSRETSGAGTLTSSATGRPYFVMELVKGVPITKYCDDKQLSLRERLELLMPVCQAVQHAHQKGIIHRDIKPTNVLIAEYDNRPVPKVIDFGVAKATAQKLTERTMFTEFGQLVGTFEYMSPEQAKLNQLDIDTRSDIYSLGVLLYELLTGTTPFERKRLQEAAFDELLRIIREEEPPKPSTKLSSSDTLPSVAANRHSEPARLSKDVRGELDWLVMKCLEKDRNRRYDTANGLAADIERYLNDEAVTACPPSAWYRTVKFARRNRVAIATATMVAVAMVLGTIVSVWQAVRAETAREAEAEQRQVAEAERSEAEKQRTLAEANFQRARRAVDEYFTLVSESKLLDVPGMQPLRKDLLEAALRYYQAMREERVDDPTVLADLTVTQLRIAKVYHELDRNDQALAAFESAVQLAERLRREYPNDFEHHRRLAGYWTVHRGTGSTKMPTDPSAAHRTLTKFLQLWEVFARESPSVEEFQSDVASINMLLALLEGGRGAAGESAAFARATVYSRKAIAIWEQLSQAHPEVSAHRENLAKAYGELQYELNRMGKADESREAWRRSRALREQLAAEFSDVPEYRAEAASRLTGHASFVAGSRPQEAEAVYRQALHDWRQLASDFPTAPQYALELARTQFKFVSLLAGPLKRPADAMKASEQGIEQFNKLVADYPQDTNHRKQLAFALRLSAEEIRGFKDLLGDAEKLHLRALAELNKLAKEFPLDPQYVEQAGHSYRYLGWIIKDAGRPEDALDNFDKGVAAFQQLADSGGPGTPGFYTDFLADTLLQKVDVLSRVGRADEAESTIRRAVDLYATLVQDSPEVTDNRRKAAAARRSFAELLAKQNRLPEASVEAQQAVHLDPHDYAVQQCLLDILTRIGDTAQTLVILRDNVAALPDCGMAHYHLAVVLEREGRDDEAIVEFQKASELRSDWEWPQVCLAQIFTRAGRFQEADEAYRKAREAVPKNAGELNNRAWNFATSADLKSRNPRWAVELAEKGVELEPQNVLIPNTLGVAHYRAGSWQKAIEWLEKSIEVRKGGNSFDWFFLAMAHWRLGNRDEARKWYGKAVEWMDTNQPQNEELRRFRAETEELMKVVDEKPTTKPPVEVK
jgi:serine/threonine protein kinase/tetratricopeptide (TPR) repeat protein